MYISQLSLTNQRIRNALKVGDSSTVSEAIRVLLNYDHEKAALLAVWFRRISHGLKINGKMTVDLAIIRMWAVGNVDIKEIEDDGQPLFVLTYTGAQVVKRLPKVHHFEALLHDHMN